jgi:hypothetical protein
LAEVLTPNQRRTLPAQRALRQKFSSEEERRAYYSRLGRLSNAGRIVLSAEESLAVTQAYDLLGRIAERARLKLANAPESETAA